MPPLTERCLGKYGKRLIGRSDLENALKRLDKLTHEEARMATAEVLRTAHAIGEGVTEVREQVLFVDDRLAGVDNRVASVNDKIAEVIIGAQITYPSPRICLISTSQMERKQTKSRNKRPTMWIKSNVRHLLTIYC
jgi:hypothetical protein